MRIRLADGPCAGSADVQLSPGAEPPEEYLVLMETGKRRKVSDLAGGTIPGVNVFAVHRLARTEADGTPVYGFVGRRESRGY